MIEEESILRTLKEDALAKEKMESPPSDWPSLKREVLNLEFKQEIGFESFLFSLSPWFAVSAALLGFYIQGMSRELDAQFYSSLVQYGNLLDVMMKVS